MKTRHALVPFALTLACSSPPETGGGHRGNPDALPACQPDIGPAFTALPVDESAIGEVIVFGELDPGGGDVIPNGQGGIRLNGQGVELRALSDGWIVSVETSTFVTSTFPEGETDFTV